MREMQIPLYSGGLYAVGSDGLHGRESLGSGLAVGSELIHARLMDHQCITVS